MQFTTGTSPADPGRDYTLPAMTCGDGCDYTDTLIVSTLGEAATALGITLTSPDVPVIDPAIREISASLGLTTTHSELSRDSYPPYRKP